MKERIISVRDIVAAIVRRWKQIIAVAIMFALLFGGVKGLLMWKAPNNGEPDSVAQLSYEKELMKLEQTIQCAEQSLVNEESYIADSLWMQINPYDKYVAEVYLSISGVDENDANMSFGQDTTPVEYLLNKITEQYQILWSAMDLPTELGLARYDAVMDKYVRELVSVQVLESNVIVVTAVGNNAEEAAELADAVAVALTSVRSVAEANSFAHNISTYHSAPKSRIDTEMADAQEAHYEKINSDNATILEAKQDIRKLANPDEVINESTTKSVLKMMVVGGLVGGLLTCAWYCVKVLLLGIVLSSNQMERILSAPFLGTVAEGRGLFVRLSSLLTGDRIWKKKEEALCYLTESTKMRSGDGKILLTSTLDLQKCGGQLDLLKEILSSANGEILSEGDNAHNPAVLAALKQCAGVVVVESIDASKAEDIIQFRKLAEEFEKPVIGFVLI